jgi:hypothetical protein
MIDDFEVVTCGPNDISRGHARAVWHHSLAGVPVIFFLSGHRIKYIYVLLKEEEVVMEWPTG